MYSNFIFKHELRDIDGSQQRTEHGVNGVEADGLGRILVRFGEFLHASGFDVTVNYSNNTVTFDWNWDDGEELDTNVVCPEEYCDDTHGLGHTDLMVSPEAIDAALAPAPGKVRTVEAHPSIFGIGQLVKVADEPSNTDSDWVAGADGTIVDTRQDNAHGSVHLVRFKGFRKPRNYPGDRDTWWVPATDLQPL